MSYQISFVEGFLADFANSPKKIQNSFSKTARNILASSPETPGPNIKKLKGYKNYWRYRISESHRIIYEVSGKEVTLHMLGDRKVVYDRMHINSDKPDVITIKAKAAVPELLEIKVGEAERGKAIIETSRAEHPHDADNDLPEEITEEKLKRWNIPEKYHFKLLTCKTEGQFLDIDIPDTLQTRFSPVMTM